MGILVIGPSWIGDAILAQPLLAALKQRQAGSSIEVLAPAWTQGVWLRMEEVTRTLNSPFRHSELALYARWQLGRQLAGADHEQAIVLPNSFKAGLIPRCAGIPLRTGYRGEWRRVLLNDMRILNPTLVPRLVDRFYALGFPADHPPGWPAPYPRLRPNQDEQSHVLQHLKLHSQPPMIALCPGAEYGPAKRWPLRHFASCARFWIGKGYQVWVFGSLKDAPLGTELTSLVAGPVHNLCGKTQLSQAIDLLALAQHVYTNDSGLMHVAAALERPLTAMFGSSSAKFTPPLSEQARICQLPLPCSPCFSRSCPLGHTRCLEELTPAELLEQDWERHQPGFSGA